MDPLNRKLGVFELLFLFTLLEGIFGDRLRALWLVGLTILFYYAKRHFGGEFTISQLQGLFQHKKEDTRP